LRLPVGTAAAFSIVYLRVFQNIRERSDAWLQGEAEVLARVSDETPQDRLYNRIIGEVAELATRELPDERNAEGQSLNSVFFLEEDTKGKGDPLWVGPSPNDAFLRAIHSAKLLPGAPLFRALESWHEPQTSCVYASFPLALGRYGPHRIFDLLH
jgi:hypothetical protein